MPLKLLLHDITKNGRVIVLLFVSFPTDSVKSIALQGQVVESLEDNTYSPPNGDKSTQSRPIDSNASLQRILQELPLSIRNPVIVILLMMTVATKVYQISGSHRSFLNPRITKFDRFIC